MWLFNSLGVLAPGEDEEYGGVELPGESATRQGPDSLSSSPCSGTSEDIMAAVGGEAWGEDLDLVFTPPLLPLR